MLERSLPDTPKPMRGSIIDICLGIEAYIEVFSFLELRSVDVTVPGMPFFAYCALKSIGPRRPMPLSNNEDCEKGESDGDGNS